MDETFDPYRKWLGIPAEDQPPNYYRLLAIERFEADPDVIAHAADARMGHLKTFQSGPYAAESQQLLNEIAAAKICLLHPKKKRIYDEQLRRQGELGGAFPPAPPPSRPRPVVEVRTALRHGTARSAASRRRRRVLWVIGLAVAATGLAVVTYYVLNKPTSNAGTGTAAPSVKTCVWS